MVRHSRWLWLLVGLAAGLVIALSIVAETTPLSSESLRRQIIGQLSEHLNSDVQLGDLDIHLFPRLRALGGDLQIRRRGSSGEPLITVHHFVIEADLAGLLRQRVARVKLDGLRVVIPPKAPAPAEGRANAEADPPSTNGPETDSSSPGRQFVIAALESDDAELVITPDASDRRHHRQPSVWTIHQLRMHDVGTSQAIPFDARLTNAIPPGEIVTAGTFGPWEADVPGDTALEGHFTFEKADLGVFRGISGTLFSRGTFGGALDRIDVNGETETPDFTVEVGNHPFSLHTTYHAVVDGTNGNTYLKRIDGSFLNSSLSAEGGVYDEGGRVPGRIVRLDISMGPARVEDVMRIAVKSAQSPMTGALRLQTKFALPPGPKDVAERLILDGRFSIAGARFTNVDVQARINALSERSRGPDVTEETNRVYSKFNGRFKLNAGSLDLPELGFEVPGAQVRLAGAYGVRSEQLDFRGTMLMDATVSQTQTGFKRLLLKVVDPLFRRKDGKAGSAIPFKINGKRTDPQFGLDYGRVFRRGSGP